MESYWADLRPSRVAPQTAPTSVTIPTFTSEPVLNPHRVRGWPRTPLGPQHDIALPVFIDKTGASLIFSPESARLTNASFALGTPFADALHELRYSPDVVHLLNRAYWPLYPDVSFDDDDVRFVPDADMDTTAPIVCVFVGPRRRRGDRTEHPYPTHFALAFWDDPFTLLSWHPPGLLVEYIPFSALPRGHDMHRWAARKR